MRGILRLGSCVIDRGKTWLGMNRNDGSGHVVVSFSYRVISSRSKTLDGDGDSSPIGALDDDELLHNDDEEVGEEES